MATDNVAARGDPLVGAACRVCVRVILDVLGERLRVSGDVVERDVGTQAFVADALLGVVAGVGVVAAVAQTFTICLNDVALRQRNRVVAGISREEA